MMLTKPFFQSVVRKVVVPKPLGVCSSFHRSLTMVKTSSKNNYLVKEVEIPTPYGNLAGRLWKSTLQKSLEDEENVSPQIITPIVCMHGWMDNCATFDTLIPLILDANMTIFAVDLPGHGHSYHTGGQHYSPLEGVMMLHRVMRFFRWPKVTIVGHSLGAVNGYIFSACYPELVTGLVAMDNLNPVPNEIRKAVKAYCSKYFQLEEKFASPSLRTTYSYDEMLDKFYKAREGSISMEGCKLLLSRGARERADMEGQYEFCHDPKLTLNPFITSYTEQSSKELANHIKCPVCMLKGEPGNDYVPREKLLEVVDVLTNSAERVEFHLVPGTHHFHLNDPHLVSSTIMRFLKS